MLLRGAATEISRHPSLPLPTKILPLLILLLLDQIFNNIHTHKPELNAYTRNGSWTYLNLIGLAPVQHISTTFSLEHTDPVAWVRFLGNSIGRDPPRTAWTQSTDGWLEQANQTEILTQTVAEDYARNSMHT
ncbi:hypothetical protein BCR44DRAFT_1031089 [Catenaria anguillulae PL171]|uniref:Uncharacterized protein n=1 Tax=Catenaria anguillulae PL171 TaxID=765915 RepID=A0A1Y2H7I8_9FUNG|nr:hypothetical protein BCR44DRAFT_1031089 [Catenaria anguillulae PL171]